MTVITRNKSKNVSSAKPVPEQILCVQPVTATPVPEQILCAEKKLVSLVKQAPPTISPYNETERTFMEDIKRLLADCELAPGKAAKMHVCLQIYNRINNNLEKILSVDSSTRWLNFAATVYNKTTEFENQRDTYKELDSRLVDLFIESYSKTRKFLSDFFKNERFLKTMLTGKAFDEMYKNIDLCDLKDKKNFRLKRNVPVVDYTGMDSIEPESNDDGITNIWQDKSIHIDPDYNPEDDKDNEDDEEDEDEDNYEEVVYKKPFDKMQKTKLNNRNEYVKKLRNYSG